MHNHEPPGYVCNFCEIVRGDDNEWNVQSDVVFRNETTCAFVNAMWWPNNHGHVLVVPTEHVENIYDVSGEVAGAIHETAKLVAMGFMETYGCDGTSTRQHNGPGGNQEVWHYHLHVFPRFLDDDLYSSARRRTTPEERTPYASRLREWIDGRA